MNAVLMALALTLQTTPPEPPQPPLKDDAPPSRELSPAHDLFYEDDEKLRPEARQTIHEFGACVAGRSMGVVIDTLRKDFRTRSYGASLQRLVRANEGCLTKRGRMRSAGLLFAGAMAEQLLKGDSRPLNVRLARAALKPSPKPYAATDKVSLCVVLSAPDEAAKLLATEVAGPQEAAAVKALAPVLGACSPPTARLEANDGGVRALVATAAFRVLDEAGATASAQRK
ncbi:MAG TPA: hypothetical protein VNT25_01490 [Allosphingosinicella sp.]|nr:hypothetical protein [Allosphingosinicella sp.]